jgi:hypothetical protein
VLTFASRPDGGRVSGALNVGMPIMLWRRSNCADQDHSDCGGAAFLHELIGTIAGTHPDDLPRHVRKLRLDAADPMAAGSHCGHGLTLFWDDPSRMPDPPLSMGA